MPSPRVPTVLALAAVFAFVLFAPALAHETSETGDRFEKHVRRLVASPTPIGPLLYASDASAWRLDVPLGTVVNVAANGTDTGPFYLRLDREGSAPSTFPAPTTHAGFLVPPGAWRVTVDPAAGVQIDITVRFASAAPFTLTSVAHDRACLLPSVCLP